MRNSTKTIVTAAASTVLGAAVALGVGPYAVADDTTDDPPDPLEAAVLVVDHTAGQWDGIVDAVHAWDAAPDLQVQLSTECQPTLYCVMVTRPSNYDRGWLGFWKPISQRVSTIQLNAADKRAADPAVQRQTIAHELGHALGLPDVTTRLGNGAVMWDPEKFDCAPDQPTKRDFDALERINDPLDGSALAYFDHQRGGEGR